MTRKRNPGPVKTVLTSAFCKNCFSIKGRPPGYSLIIFLLLCIFHADAQNFSAETLKPYSDWPRSAQISRFYQLNGERPAWIGNMLRQKELLSLIELSSSIGLNEADYQGEFFRRYQAGASLETIADSIETDIRFTDAVIHLFSEVKGGNKVPSFGYYGLNYAPDLSEIVPAIKKQLDAGKLNELFIQLQPKSIEYVTIQEMLGRFQQVANGNGFTEVKITSAATDSSNRPLLERLYQLGITDSVLTAVDNNALQVSIKAAQRMFDLAEDGVPGSATQRAMNVSLFQRIEELKLALNTLRWLEDIKQTGTALILNIPAAGLLVYEKGKVVLESKVIVGKPSTPTPTLTSTISEVILYPYWNVTYNIATRELLPHIRRNIGYLQKNNFQVLNKQGKVLDPYSINWQALSPAYFPYLIRQSTGCDNSLGIVKFNFYNPFTVYLHDTPAKTLFSSGKRFYSHGCMRVEKPVELARYLLGFNRIAIDTLTEKGCLTHQAPTTVRIEKPLPVIVLYSTVWHDSKGSVRFYNDVYKRLDGLLPRQATLPRASNILPGTAYHTALPSVHQ